jgi:hypothetical protein
MREKTRRRLFTALVVLVLLQTGAHIAQSFVNYPAWDAIGSGFADYHHQVAVRAGFFLFLPRIMEVLLTFLVIRYRPAAVPLWTLLVGLALAAGAIASTALVQRPLHVQLEALGNTPELLSRLRSTDLVRHLLGVGRAIIYLGVLFNLVASPETSQDTASQRFRGAA